MTTGLLPCPWCGSRDLIMPPQMYRMFGFEQVGCKTCGASGPRHREGRDIADLWNRRFVQMAFGGVGGARSQLPTVIDDFQIHAEEMQDAKWGPSHAARLADRRAIICSRSPWMQMRDWFVGRTDIELILLVICAFATGLLAFIAAQGVLW
ncbi:Lar family restriction alleviation protein [Aestuariibius insulae]